MFFGGYILKRIGFCGVIVSVIFALSLCVSAMAAEYEGRVFGNDTVHTLDIQISDRKWDKTTENAKDQLCKKCDIVYDGEVLQKCGITPQYDLALTTVNEADEDYYSFLITFDEFSEEQTLFGLDSMLLDNMCTDKTCMKSYLAYNLMRGAGAKAPLCTYVYVTVNGEALGLYLAVEGIDDSFMERCLNYNKADEGSIRGNVYKPEMMSVMEWDTGNKRDKLNSVIEILSARKYQSYTKGDRVCIIPDALQIFIDRKNNIAEAAKLKYVGKSASKYKVFFDTSVENVSRKAKARFVKALNNINSEESSEDYVYVEPQLRYFVGDTFMVNSDGYAGAFCHNYYMYESWGKLLMLPGNYSRAFGAENYNSIVRSLFGDKAPYLIPDTKNAMDMGTAMVNTPIDTPVFGLPMEDRPLINKLLSNPQYLNSYHTYFDEFLKTQFESGEFEKLYNGAYNNIKPYVTEGKAFCDGTDFEASAKALHDFCSLRARSVRYQLNGTIPSTVEGQKNDPSKLVDGSKVSLDTINITDMTTEYGFTQEVIEDLIGAVTDDNTAKNSEGFLEAVSGIKYHPVKLYRACKVLMGVEQVRYLVFTTVAPVTIVLILIIIGVLIIRHRIKKSKALQEKEEQENKDE